MICKNNIIEELCKNFKKEFDNRIICLLYYGSNAFNREIKKNSDYDFCLVLDERKQKDLYLIRKITKDFLKIELTVHYLKDLEEDGWDNFQSDNHGVFFLYHFASAKAIIGDNIFARKIHLIQTNDIIDSLRRQIIEYFWRLDNKIFTLSDDELVESDIFRKYPVRITQDLLIVRGDISFAEINKINYNEFFDKFIKDKKYFRNETKELLYNYKYKNVKNEHELIEIHNLARSKIFEFREMLYNKVLSTLKQKSETSEYFHHLVNIADVWNGKVCNRNNTIINLLRNGRWSDIATVTCQNDATSTNIDYAVNIALKKPAYSHLQRIAIKHKNTSHKTLNKILANNQIAGCDEIDKRYQKILEKRLEENAR